MCWFWRGLRGGMRVVLRGVLGGLMGEMLALELWGKFMYKKFD